MWEAPIDVEMLPPFVFIIDPVVRSAIGGNENLIAIGISEYTPRSPSALVEKLHLLPLLGWPGFPFEEVPAGKRLNVTGLVPTDPPPRIRFRQTR